MILNWLALIMCVIVTLLMPASQAFAQSLEVVALVTTENEQTNQFIGSLRADNVSVRKIDVSTKYAAIPLSQRISNAQSIIILGKEAYQYYLDNQLDIPALVLFVKSSTFHHLAKASTHIALVDNISTYQSKMSAIYSDPSPKEQMALIKRHYPYPAVATLLSPLNYYLEAELKRDAQELGLKLAVIKVAEEFDVNRALNTLPPKHALLALPDQYIYNTLNLKNIIISTYRSGRPIFGFGSGMVKAGAVASLVTGSEELAKQSIIVLSAMKTGKTVREYSRFGNLVVNDAVARSLNLISLQQIAEK